MSDAAGFGRLLEVLRDLESWLNSFGVPHATIGGVAVSLIARPRFTNDVDLVIWMDRDQWPSLLDAGAMLFS